MREFSLAQYALKTFVALKSPSVKEINTHCIYELEQAMKQGEDGFYIGIKDSHVIPSSLINDLKQSGFFYHTKDVASPHGRAVDPFLINPITLRQMSGSSSGTAINVFLKINDCGIGTDGGGSVLAPALALNLFGMISPLYYASEMKNHQKQSTDQISFTPSLGLMSQSLEVMIKLHHALLPNRSKAAVTAVFASSLDKSIENRFNLPSIELSYACLNRKQMIQELLAFDFENHLLITQEGPVDLLSYGDSIMGHYDSMTQSLQAKSGKAYLKVVNMAKLSAICVPNGQLSSGYLIICKSDIAHLNAALEFALTIKQPPSVLENQYFSIENQI